MGGGCGPHLRTSWWRPGALIDAREMSTHREGRLAWGIAAEKPLSACGAVRLFGARLM